MPPVTVVVPLSRPHRAMASLEAYCRQRYDGPRRLVVVENGDAIGSIKPLRHVPNLHVMSSDHSHSAARNAGLDWARANGGGSWAMMDDDDYYGPGYLEGQAVAALHSGAEVVGKAWHYVMWPDGLYRIRSHREHCWDEVGLTGGTLFGLSCDGLPRFEERVDDDLAWCAAARAVGLRTWASGRHGYCYDRSRDEPRVYEASPSVARRALSGEGVGSDYFGAVPVETVDDVFARPLMEVPPPTASQIFADI